MNTNQNSSYFGREDNIEMLYHTREILDKGYYIRNRRRVDLKLTPEEMREIRVFLPEEVQEISSRKDFKHVRVIGRMGVSCKNMDSFALAAQRYREQEEFDGAYPGTGEKPILVLNLANPVNPGGGVYKGSRAQEESLCRRSSLLLSLEDQEAEAYYNYNKALHTFMGSDAIMITPQVEIIKDEEGKLLEDTMIVSVMTCAAPMLTYGMEGMSQEEYRAMVYGRIMGMLKVAAYLGYENLVLGAFGCGAFDNDAMVVSNLFYRAMKEFDFDGMRIEDFFRRIDFAVLSRSATQYNYRQFARCFADFYRKEDERAREEGMERKAETEKDLDRIRGCLIGGAVGDALGYPIEFLGENRIFGLFGKEGITKYALRNGVAEISDDTQMTLFTATGILVGDTRMAMRGIGAAPRQYVACAYGDWLKTQQTSYNTGVRGDAGKAAGAGSSISWLMEVPELYARRYPGNTCLAALEYRRDAKPVEDFIDDPINMSKGCGGVMRVAPLALRYRMGAAGAESDSGNYHGSPEALDMEAAQIAAITHSHSLGYMPAAVISHIISRIISDGCHMNLEEIVLDARETVAKLFAGDAHLPVLLDKIDLALKLSREEGEDLAHIHALGEGWVAEETMAIALYCALKYRDDFSKAVITAVNHRGDSDSTGAVTGNLVGALVGYDAIEAKWKKNLELQDVILEVADDLCHGCQMSEFDSYCDPDWEKKYIYMHR